MILTCLKIFFARIFDVTLGAFRTVYTVKGKEVTASIVAFIEVFIWFVVAKEALVNTENSIFIPISYALGYSTGTFIGTFLSKTFIRENILLEAIIPEKNKDIINLLKEKNYTFSLIKLESEDNKFLLVIETYKKNIKSLIKTIKNQNKDIFIVISESKIVHNNFLK